MLRHCDAGYTGPRRQCLMGRQVMGGWVVEQAIGPDQWEADTA